MGYAKVSDFEKGTVAALWEKAIEGDGLEWPMADEKVAARMRYQVNGFRARAREAGYEKALDMDQFVVKIVSIEGRCFLKWHKASLDIPNIEALKTRRELEEEKELLARADAFAVKMLQQGLVEEVKSEPVVERYEAKSEGGKDAQRRGAPESIIRSLDRAAELRVKGVLGS